MKIEESWMGLDWLSDARSLLEWMTLLGNKSAIMLVRHSERLVNLNPSDTLKAELTPTGHEMAIEFGRRLPRRRKITLLHSPNIRTTQTAERIAEGVANAGGTLSEISYVDILWGPESDYLQFSALLEEHGFPEVYRRWIKGKIPQDVFEPIDQFVKRFTPYTIDRLENMEPNSIDVLITHDLVIDIAQRKFLNIDTDTEWFDVPFLSGLGFTKTDDIIIGRYRGLDYPLTKL